MVKPASASKWYNGKKGGRAGGGGGRIDRYTDSPTDWEYYRSQEINIFSLSARRFIFSCP